MNETIDIQANLRQILKEKGILQKQVAQSLGMTEQGLSNWFTRKTDMTFDQITRICGVAGISVIDAVTWPIKYVPEEESKPICEECKRKDEIIDNLQELLRKYKQDTKKKKEWPYSLL